MPKKQSDDKENRRPASDGPERLKLFLVRGILDDDFIAAFFSQVRKVPAKLKHAAAAVTMTDAGVKLVYDMSYMANATDEEIRFTLAHELMHVLGLHFVRSYDLMDELGVGMREFFGAYAPLSDAVVNNSLRNMQGAEKEWKKLLTYDSLPPEVDYNSHPTFEAIVRYMFQEHPPKKPGEFNGKNGRPTIVVVDDQGNTTIIQDGDEDGPVVVISDVSREAQREHMEDVKNLVQSALKSAGNTPNEIQRAVDEFLEVCQNSVLKGWGLLQRFLTGFRTINKGKIRSLKRLNRRTGMLPGRTQIKGFRALFITDESGSMSDEDVSIALALAKKTVLRENADKLYYMHWDTEPCTEVEELKSESDVSAIERRKDGGTNFTDMFTHDLVAGLDVDLYIILTDGYPYGGPENGWPVGRPLAPAAWIITTKQGFSAWEEQCKKGIAVCVEEE